MNNVDKFLERLKTFKPLVDDGKIPKKSFDATRSYLELPHFNRCNQLRPRLSWILWLQVVQSTQLPARLGLLALSLHAVQA